MSRTTRLTAAVGAALTLTALTGLAAVTSPAQAAPASSRTVVAHRAGPMTKVTIAAPDCEGCQVQLFSDTWPREHAGQHYFQSHSKNVANGKVTFTMPTRLTRGLSVQITAPWEGNLGANTMVAFGYPGRDTGDHQTFAFAKKQHRATGCFAGTSAKHVTFDVATDKVPVKDEQGNPATGDVAFTPTVPATMAPYVHAYKGILGAQDIIICGHDH